MNKLPVFRTFGRAVGFTLWNFLTIFRLTWLPFALLIAANIGVGIYAQRMLLADKPLIDPFSIGNILDDFIFLNLLVLVLQSIAVAAAAVSIHRVILFNDRTQGGWLNFPFGGTEFLYVLMGVVSFIIIMLVIAAVMAPALFFISGGDFAGFFEKLQEGMKDWPPKDFREKGFPPGFVPIMVSYALAWLVALYFVLRLFVWPPAIVATRSFAFGEAWSLTKGNVWRFIGLCALVFFTLYLWVVLLAGGAYYYYTMKMQQAAPASETQIVESVKTVEPPKSEPPAAPEPVPPAPATESAAPAPEATPPAVSADDLEVDAPSTVAEGRRAAFERSMERYQSLAPVMWFIELLLYVLGTGFGVALLSYSYKALKGYEAHEPIPNGG